MQYVTLLIIKSPLSFDLKVGGKFVFRYQKHIIDSVYFKSMK